ncbi:MAG: hypothetical protein UY56_C0015G0015, partial [Parcubacteria group bacterium GW2011_GWA1_50_14]
VLVGETDWLCTYPEAYQPLLGMGGVSKVLKHYAPVDNFLQTAKILLALDRGQPPRAIQRIASSSHGGGI